MIHDTRPTSSFCHVCCNGQLSDSMCLRLFCYVLPAALMIHITVSTAVDAHNVARENPINMTPHDPQHNYGSDESGDGDFEDGEDSAEIDFEEFCIESQITNQ